MSRDYKPSEHLVGGNPAPEVSARTALISAVLFFILLLALGAVSTTEPSVQCAAPKQGTSK